MRSNQSIDAHRWDDCEEAAVVEAKAHASIGFIKAAIAFVAVSLVGGVGIAWLLVKWFDASVNQMLR